MELNGLDTDFFLSVGLGLGRTETPELRMRKSISSERTFRATDDEDFLFQKLGDIAETLSNDMKEKGLSGRTLTLKLKTDSFEVRTRATSLQKCIQSKEDILSCASRILKAELPLSLRLIGLRMSHFNDDKNSPVDPMQKSIVGFLSGEGANFSAMPSKKQDCLETSDKIEDQEGPDFSEGHSMQYVEFDSTADDDHTVTRKDDRFSLLCESHGSDSSSIAKKFKINDSYLVETKPNESVEPNELTHSVEAQSTQIEEAGLIWVDDYICSVCGIEMPPSFIMERGEHSDYHLAEMLQKEETSYRRCHLAHEGRFEHSAAHNRESVRKKQKCSPKEVKHIPIEAFFSKCKKNS
ncbi:uncharacterized protein LOC110018016 [Phalaenopsis equestris]|uniref:uncharacterized protein LOC110018016 n=1 Tax=Phalaenopsis equestris TaxID=78828 RepID=UPI0009E41CAC|nr:uncharacterized protein LOC110018016 [Phalaenopsis equestris]